MDLNEKKVVYAAKFTETILEARHFVRDEDIHKNQSLEPLEFEIALYLLHGRLAKKAEFNKKLTFWNEENIAEKFTEYVGRSRQPRNSSVCRTLYTLENLKLISVIKEGSKSDAFTDLKKIKISYLLSPYDIKKYHDRANKSITLKQSTLNFQ